MIKYFTPKINANVPLPDGIGDWYRTSATILNQIGNNFDKGSEITAIFDDSEIKAAIPDIWASVILFNLAFGDATNSLHKQVMAEWRGILALLALKDVLELPITVINLDFKNHAPTKLSAILSNTPNYHKTLSGNSTAWDKVDVILYNNKPIAITSPFTLFCPAVSYTNKLDCNIVKWFNGHKLQDPFTKDRFNNYEHLTIEEVKMLTEWLDKLAKNVDLQENLNLDLKAQLLQHIKDFLACGTSDKTNFKHLATPFHFKYELAGIVDTAIEAEERDPSSSNLLIKNIDDKYYILLAKDAANQWGKKEQDIFVVGSQTLSAYNSIRERKDTYKNVKLIEPDELFHDNLVIIVNPLPGCKNIFGSNSLLQREKDNTSIILPIKEELLQLYTIDEIVQNSSISINAQNEYVFTFKFILKNNKEGLKYSFSKIFKTTNLVRDNPVFEIWPNFKSNRWKTYYIYLRYYVGNKEIIFKPYSKSAVISNKSFSASKSEIWALNLAPEIINCTFNNAECGFIFPNLYDLDDQNPTNTLLVGVDFGTENTNICTNILIHDSASKEPEPLQIDGEYLLAITSIGAERRRSLIHGFLSPDDIEAPFQSVYHSFDNADTVFFSGHILFSQNGIGLPNLNDGKVNINLKWSKDVNDRVRLFLYLRQVILHCVAVAVQNHLQGINIRYAFPSAFDENDRSDYKNFWHITLPAYIKNIANITFHVEEPYTESVAAAIYHQASANGLVSIDIGGGTTDISIWQNNELLFQTSIIVAGRALFTELFYHNPPLLKLYTTGCNEVLLEEFKKESKNEIRAALVLDRIVDDEEHFNNRFPVITGDPIFQDFILNSQFQFLAIMFYLNNIIYDLDGFNRTKHVEIIFGGNGSKVLKWYGNSTFFEKAKTEILKHRIPSLKYHCTTSQKPKFEVAQGMIMPAPKMKFDRNLAPSTYISGEFFRIQNIDYNPSREIAEADYLKGISLPNNDKELKNFTSFLQILNKNNEHVKWDYNNKSGVDFKGTLSTRVNQDLSNRGGNDRKKLTDLPLFFIILSEYLKLRNGEK